MRARSPNPMSRQAFRGWTPTRFDASIFARKGASASGSGLGRVLGLSYRPPYRKALIGKAKSPARTLGRKNRSPRVCAGARARTREENRVLASYRPNLSYLIDKKEKPLGRSLGRLGRSHLSPSSLVAKPLETLGKGGF